MIAKTNADSRGQIFRLRGGLIVVAEVEKPCGGRAIHKDVKNEGRSGNVYENKGPDDKLPGTKNDTSTQLHDVCTEDTRIVHKPSAFLSLFERWGTNPSLQHIEARVR